MVARTGVELPQILIANKQMPFRLCHLHSHTFCLIELHHVVKLSRMF